MAGLQRALVASDSRVTRDPRVLRQIRWLIESGWVVDSLGRGPRPPEVNGIHHEMPVRHRLSRLLANTLLPRRIRYRALVESAIPQTLRNGGVEAYDLMVLNEIELLPWFTRVKQRLMAAGGSAHLDLHEFAPSQRRGLVHNLLFRRYRTWLADFIGSRLFTSRSVVSPGVAELYAIRYGIAPPVVVRNVPDYVDQQPSGVNPSDVRLLYHGNAAAMRRVDLAIDAVAELESRFSLHLMLVGSQQQIESLQKRARPFGDRIRFHPAVDVHAVAREINDYDLEIIFAPPATENMRHGLPNKLFESIQGRLGIVTGQSPDKAALVTSCGNGVIVDGWTSRDLARTINALTTADVERMKAASHAVAPQLNSQTEKHRFLGALGGAQAVH